MPRDIALALREVRPAGIFRPDTDLGVEHANRHMRKSASAQLRASAGTVFGEPVQLAWGDDEEAHAPTS